MKFLRPIAGGLITVIVLTSSLLAGCSPAARATSQPTQDPATLAAATASALNSQMTEQALNNPSPTPTLTATTAPTDTPVPPTATFTTTPTATPAEPTLTPTATATTAPAISAKFLSAGAFPQNKTLRVPNEKFSLAIRYLNTGTSAWGPGYRLKLVGFKGVATVQLEAELGQTIAPGQPVEFDLWAFGSETLGLHIWYFQLFTPQGIPVPGGAASYSYTSH